MQYCIRRVEQLPTTLINQFLVSLIALTKERDALALEQTLKQTIKSLVRLFTNNDVQSVEIYPLKEISKLFFNAVTDMQSVNARLVSDELCQSLLDCYNTGENCVSTSSGGKKYHLFPIKHEVVYNNAVVAVEADYDNAGLALAITQLLDIYHNYNGLLNDNERDTLTGLLNRKTFDQKINKIMSALHTNAMRQDDRAGISYFIAIFDIDHFKRVNDEYGHLIGDEVLLLFSQMMTKSFRESDPLFRFGGEEFVGIFGCALDADISVVLKRFTDRLQAFSFPQVGKITASVGYTKLTDDSMPSQLVDRADLALYYAKNHGRNQTCSYDELKAEGLLQEDIKEGEIELF
jgi:diguanylate cyclase (GGDEF)-like protein